MNKTLRGHVPRWDHPTALREAAPPIRWDRADHSLRYAKSHARHVLVTHCAGLLGEAACHAGQAGHAILAHRGEWITNEKQLLKNRTSKDR